MYATSTAKETRPEVLLKAIGDLQLAALVTATPSGLIASHLPVTVRENGGAWLLDCHVARANPLWKQIADGCSALAIFQGPHAYIHPGWFVSVSAKQDAVPTWTYIAVHVHGTLTAVHDEAWLSRHLAQLASNNEVDRPQAWSLSDLASEAKASLLKGIVGLELTVERMEGSWKMAQSLPRADRRAVAEALAASARPRDTEVAAIMTDLLRTD